MPPPPFRAALRLGLAAALVGCGNAARTNENSLEARLAEAEARAARAEDELHKARILLDQQATNDAGAGFEEEAGDAGDDDPGAIDPGDGDIGPPADDLVSTEGL